MAGPQGTYRSATPVLTDGMSSDLNLDASGNLKVAGSTGGTAAAPAFERVVGAPTVATAQAATSISPAAATSLVASRAGRQSVTLTNITGTQPVYITATAATTGATTGYFLAAATGASVTIQTTAALFGTSPTAAQTVAVLETY